MEADVLRWSLLVIGSFVIVGFAVHGIWLSRKNSDDEESASKHKKDQEYQPSGWQLDADTLDEVVDDTNDGLTDDPDIKFDFGVDEAAVDFTNATSTKNELDDLGLGAVRVVSSEPSEDTDAEPIFTTQSHVEPEATSSKIYASVVTQPKPEYAAKYSTLAAKTVAAGHSNTSQKSRTQPFTGASNKSLNSNHQYQASEPPPFLLKNKARAPEGTSDSWVKDEEKPHANPAEKSSEAEQAHHSVKKPQELNNGNEQPITKPNIKEEPKAEPSAPEQPQEVLVLNVKCADDNPIPGSALLPMLLTLGFKFGDQDIFHRHVNSNGKGAVLFSLANMFKPGNFDIDNLENFTTQGISLFMILPIESEPHQVFNMMHNAARKIAEEFAAQIYDGRRTLLTKQSLQQYVERIRKFERQRLSSD